MHRVIVVVARHIAWQHAGVGCVHVVTNEREAHARQWPHAKALEHTHMAVTAAD